MFSFRWDDTIWLLVRLFLGICEGNSCHKQRPCRVFSATVHVLIAWKYRALNFHHRERANKPVSCLNYATKRFARRSLRLLTCLSLMFYTCRGFGFPPGNLTRLHPKHKFSPLIRKLGLTESVFTTCISILLAVKSWNSLVDIFGFTHSGKIFFRDRRCIDLWCCHLRKQNQMLFINHTLLLYTLVHPLCPPRTILGIFEPFGKYCFCITSFRPCLMNY